jgi:hypothetical protein
MSSLTVTVTGTDPAALSCDFFPPLELTDGEWCVGLLDFTTYNSIPNVVEGKNNVFPVQDGNNWNHIKLPTGAYEIDDIEAYLKKSLGETRISIRPNNNTLKCELYSAFTVDFAQSDHDIGRMLGFTKKAPLAAYITHTSDATVDIITVNTIMIRCNIVQGSYKNGVNEHTLHSFYPTVEPGFKIVETPTNVIYLPVNVRRVDNITLSVVDQQGETVNFRDEVITARLHLKRIL